MIELNGKYNSAKVFTDKIEETAKDQIIELCDQEFAQNAKIRIMPDVHAGKGCVIGFTADLGDKVIPNLIGVDIGCGVFVVELGKTSIDLVQLDQIINIFIPAGMNVHEGRMVRFPLLEDLYCFRDLKDTKRIVRAIGSLGGGNHYIELNKDQSGNIYLVIHSGSRNLGKQVAMVYQNLAINLCSGKEEYFIKKENLIKNYKDQGKRSLIQVALKELKNQYECLQPAFNRDLCYLTGEYRDKYLHDMNICQQYAELNRQTIANIILGKTLNKTVDDFSTFHTTHNYINFKDNIIRKGSISAYQGEKVIIPINMRDGSIIAIGKGNPEWNYSAPHGAGRVMSRKQALEHLSMAEYKKSMEGIYTTSVNQSTLDEAPMAYKPIEDIVNNIGGTVEVIEIIKPLYNFKAGA